MHTPTSINDSRDLDVEVTDTTDITDVTITDVTTGAVAPTKAHCDYGTWVQVPLWFADRDAIPAEYLEAARDAFRCGDQRLEAHRLYCYQLWLCGWTGTPRIPPRPVWQLSHDDAVQRALAITCLHAQRRFLRSEYWVNDVLFTGSKTARTICVGCGRVTATTQSYSSPAFHSGQRSTPALHAIGDDVEVDTLAEARFVRTLNVTVDGTTHTVAHWFADKSLIPELDVDDAVIALGDDRLVDPRHVDEAAQQAFQARMVHYMNLRSGIVEGVANPAAMVGHSAARRQALAAHPRP
jgi:hypothetical protein